MKFLSLKLLDSPIRVFIYFIFVLILTWGSGCIGTQLAIYFNPSLGMGNLAGDDLSFSNIFLSCIFFPTLETSMLVYCICISMQIFKYSRVAIISSVIPIAAMHALDFWQLSLIVFIPFYFMSLAYVNLRSYFSMLRSMAFISAIHGVSNLFSISLVKF